MRTDKIRKYLIPNIPYLFILWAFLKLGTAYRLAAGNDFAHKLIGLGQTIGPAFADFAPGLAPLDWLVGIVGAVGFRLLIYFKSKNAKKFRRDAEYGSARWGTEKDIKPFVDPRFENNVILTGTEFLTMNTRPKIPANARNLNCCIIGSSGSGKTRFWLIDADVVGCVERINHELEIAHILNLVEKQIGFTLVGELRLDVAVELIGIGELTVGVVIEIDEHKRIRFRSVEMFSTDFDCYLLQQDRFAAPPHPGNDFDQLGVVKRANPLEILRSQDHSELLSIELILLNSIMSVLHSIKCI